jgi:hypothetical protein
MDSVFKEYAYPINNYNYNYKTYVDNNYSIGSMGVNSNPTLNQFKTNINALNNFTKPLIIDPIPTAKSVAGVGDVDYGDSAAVAKAQKGFRQQAPYNRFRYDYPESQYPTSGIYSSSYFVQSGFCPVASATSSDQCYSRDPNYIWMGNILSLPDPAKSFFKNQTSTKNQQGGNCYKPRYSYINNANDSGLLEGLIPGIVGDVIDMNPGNFMRTMDGNAVPGSTDTSPPRFQLLPCISEEFVGSDKKNTQCYWTYILGIFLGIFLIYLIRGNTRNM